MALRTHRRKLMLITGGSGFLGRHLTNGHATDRWEVVAPSSASMDVRRHESTIDAITDWKPQVVVHLAYRKGDRRSIVDGSRHVAEAAERCSARLIHMSSDMVFSGRPAPYAETDVPFPSTDYGRDKRDAELAVREACPSAVIVRTSLLYGTDHLAPVQHDVRRALSSGSDHRPMTFFTDEFRCPAHADDIAAAIVDLSARRDFTGVLHLAGPDAISRADFARSTARWLGLSDAALKTSTIAAAGLVRPSRVVLDTGVAAGLAITCRSVRAVLRPTT